MTNIDAKTNPDTKSISTEKEYASEEFSNKEITSECDAKTGICHYEECSNGKCKKYSKYQNGTEAKEEGDKDKLIKNDTKVAASQLESETPLPGTLKPVHEHDQNKVGNLM